MDLDNEINEKFARSSWGILPEYGKRSLLEVPHTIFSLFGMDSDRPALPGEFFDSFMGRFNKIVMLFVDGLGCDQILQNKSANLFKLLTERGAIYPITTVFPSTTAAAITTVHTGLSPAEHGLPEWNVYFPELDTIIETLPFRPSGSAAPADSLRKEGVDPRILYSGPTVYTRLAEAGVPSYGIFPENLTGSAYSACAQKGAKLLPYRRASDMLVSLRRKLREERGRAYFFVYWPQIDSAGHEFGPNSAEQRGEVSALSHMVTSEFFEKLDRNTASETLFLLCADHGQIRVKKENVIFIDKRVAIVEFLRPYYGGGKGLILPTGHPRDVFLHVRDDKLDYAVDALRGGLGGIAEVMPMRDAYDRMLFGDRLPSERFIERAGDILLVPYGHTCLWNTRFWKDPNILKGIHGGLSREEMLIPFGIAHMSDLCR